VVDALAEKNKVQHSRVFKVLLAVCIIIAPSGVHWQNGARVTGTVFTPYEFDEAVVPEVTIEFASDKSTTQAMSDPSGKYSVTLLPGGYQVTASRAGFCPVQRAEFNAEAGSDILITLVIIPCPTHVGSPLETQSIRPKRPKQPKPFVITFANRRIRSGDVEYHGMKIGDHHIAAVVTYDSLAIYAETLIVMQNSSRLRAQGHVVIEDGKSRRRVDQATIDFDADNPMATLRTQ
jgi:hypothetical protein